VLARPPRHVVIQVTLGVVDPPGWQQASWKLTATVVVDPGGLHVVAIALYHLLISP